MVWRMMVELTPKRTAKMMPAMAEMDPRFGVEAALSAFDHLIRVPVQATSEAAAA